MLMMRIAAAGGIVVFLNARWIREELATATDGSGAKSFLWVVQDQKYLCRSKAKNLTLFAVRDGYETLDLAYSKLFGKIDKKGWLEHCLQREDSFCYQVFFWHHRPLQRLDPNTS